MKPIFQNVIKSNSIVLIVSVVSVIISFFIGIMRYDGHDLQLRIITFMLFMALVLFPVFGNIDKMIREIKFGGNNSNLSFWISILVLFIVSFSNISLYFDSMIHIAIGIIVINSVMNLHLRSNNHNLNIESTVMTKLEKSNSKLWNVKYELAETDFFRYTSPKIIFKYSFKGLELFLDDKKFKQIEIDDIENTLEKNIFDISEEDFVVYEMMKI